MDFAQTIGSRVIPSAQRKLNIFKAMKSVIFGSRIALLCLLVMAPFNRMAFAQVNDDKHATFFMGRVRYSANDGNDCSGVGQDLMKLVSRASTLKIQEERKVKLTDPDLYETPFLFMNGHN